MQAAEQHDERELEVTTARLGCEIGPGGSSSCCADGPMGSSEAGRGSHDTNREEWGAGSGRHQKGGEVL